MKLTLTEAAKKRISEVCKEGEFVRLSLIGGGCHGFSYKFGFEKEISPDDFTILDETSKKVQLAVKKVFLEKIQNSFVDFITNISSSYFVLKSENFASTCGCGTSFSLKGDDL
jgi:iron-sulfur cluster assembly accessory protein